MGVRLPFRLVVLLVAAVESAACGGTDVGLARVGGRQLEIAPFQDYLGEASGEPWAGVNARVASGLLDQYIDRQVVLETARRREMLTATDVSRLGPGEMAWMLEELCGPPPEPSPDDINREVERRLEQVLPARAHVRQILVDSLEAAENARSRLAAGEDFVKVSREMSRAPNAMDGGELGSFFEGSLPKEIDRVVFALTAGAISNPVQGPSGYHVFQVLEMTPAGPPERAAVESAVTTEFAEQGARHHTRSCIARLASEIGVEVESQNLWFAYDGKYAEGRGDA